MKEFKRLATFRDFIGEATVTYKRTTLPQEIVRTSKDAYDFIKPYFIDFIDDHEEAKIIHLSKSNGIVNIDHISKGGDSACYMPMKNIIRNALYIKTASVIVVHNHPSGRKTPSISDKEVSNKLKQAFKLLDMQMLDFMVITREGYYSFADEGLI